MKNKKRILVLCDTFPPDLGVGGRRWQKFCEAMNPVYEVTVIAGTYAESKIERHNGILGNIHRVPYPKFRLDSYIGTFGSKPRKDKLDGAEADAAKTSESAEVRSGWRQRCGKIFAWLRSIRLLLPIADLNRGYGNRICKYVRKNWSRSDFDLIVASHPGSGNLFAANKLNKYWSIPWIADFRDPWAQDYHCPFGQNSLLQRLYTKLERNTISSAYGVVTINKYLAKLLAIEPKKIFILPNSFSISERSLATNGLKKESKSLKLSYVGCVVDKSDFHYLAEGLAKVEWGEVKRPVFWRQYGPPDADCHLRAAMDGRMLHNINYENHGNLDHEVLLDRISDSNYNVIFGYNGKSSQCIYSGKVFDYMAVDAPVLLIGGSQESALYNLMSKGAKGYWLEQEEDVANFFQGKPPTEPKKIFVGDKSKLNSYKSEQVNNDWMELLNNFFNGHK